MRRHPTHRIHSFISLSLPPSLPRNYSLLSTTRFQGTEQPTDQTKNQNSPSDPVPNPATDRACCRLFPPPTPPLMGSADRSEIDGIVVAEKGARSCVECRATTTPMWRSGPTGPRVSSSSSSPPSVLVLRCSVLFVFARIRFDQVGDSDS
ncbi:hypothetical protein BAE44_0006612 [Dichanthelium oligosanthes]|uniref:GATA-type domain-containing protein n=1 Tax=Dichanthelium oligosanthes TaxID=888268 RepID=A0A1E5W4W1_9POAL|nr:hypothetical protein BAE44_0006612 [Dichanthelium oligosanthes]